MYAINEADVQRIVNDLQDTYDNREDAIGDGIDPEEEPWGMNYMVALNRVFGTSNATTTTTVDDGAHSAYEQESESSESEDDEYEEDYVNPFEEGDDNEEGDIVLGDSKDAWQKRIDVRKIIYEKLGVDVPPLTCCHLASMQLCDEDVAGALPNVHYVSPNFMNGLKWLRFEWSTPLEFTVDHDTDQYNIVEKLASGGGMIVDGRRYLNEDVTKNIMEFIVPREEMVPVKLISGTLYYSCTFMDQTTRLCAMSETKFKDINFPVNWALEEDMVNFLKQNYPHEQVGQHDISHMSIVGGNAMRWLANNLHERASLLAVLSKVLLNMEKDTALICAGQQWLEKVTKNLPSTIYLMNFCCLAFKKYAPAEVINHLKKMAREKKLKRTPTWYGKKKRDTKTDILLRLLFTMKNGKSAEFRSYFPETLLNDDNKLSGILKCLLENWENAKTRSDLRLPANEPCPLPITPATVEHGYEGQYTVDYEEWLKREKNNCISAGKAEDFHPGSAVLPRNDIMVQFEASGEYCFTFHELPKCSVKIEWYNLLGRQKKCSEIREYPLHMLISDIKVHNVSVLAGECELTYNGSDKPTRIYQLAVENGRYRCIKILRTPLRIPGCQRLPGEELKQHQITIYKRIANQITESLEAQGTEEVHFPLESERDGRWLVVLMCHYRVYMLEHNLLRVPVWMSNDIYEFYRPTTGVPNRDKKYIKALWEDLSPQDFFEHTNCKLDVSNPFKPTGRYIGDLSVDEHRLITHSNYTRDLFQHVKHQVSEARGEDDFLGTYLDLLLRTFRPIITTGVDKTAPLLFAHTRKLPYRQYLQNYRYRIIFMERWPLFPEIPKENIQVLKKIQLYITEHISTTVNGSRVRLILPEAHPIRVMMSGQRISYRRFQTIMHCVHEFKLRHGLSRNYALPGTRSQTNGYEMEPLTLEHFQGIGFNFRGDISQWHVFERPAEFWWQERMVAIIDANGVMECRVSYQCTFYDRICNICHGPDTTLSGRAVEIHRNNTPLSCPVQRKLERAWVREEKRRANATIARLNEEDNDGDVGSSSSSRKRKRVNEDDDDDDDVEVVESISLEESLRRNFAKAEEEGKVITIL